MLEWIKNLEPEFLILFGFSAIFFIVLLVVLGKNQRILDLIGKRALSLQEDLLHRDDMDVIDILIANTSYVNVEAGAVGFIYQKVFLPLSETSLLILARDSHKISIPLNDLRTFVIGRSDKVKKIEIYVEDSLGRRTIRKAVNAKRKLKDILKEEKNAKKAEDKKVRYETGNYLLFERIGLIFKYLFSPFTKLSRAIKSGLNKQLRNREVKLEIKEKEKKHKQEMQQVFDEQRREEMILQTEKKILADKKAKQAEIKQAEKRRREEMAKVKEETRVFEEEIKKEQQEKDDEFKDENEVKIDENITEKDTDIKQEETIGKDEVSEETEAQQTVQADQESEVKEPVKTTPKKRTPKIKKEPEKTEDESE